MTLVLAQLPEDPVWAGPLADDDVGAVEAGGGMVVCGIDEESIPPTEGIEVVFRVLVVVGLIRAGLISTTLIVLVTMTVSVTCSVVGRGVK